MTLTYRQKVGFTYEYYVLDQIKKDYDMVWHWKDFPEKLMYENNLINDYDVFCKYRYDIGADLVALKNNKYYFIQCKNFNDTILMEKLAGFYFLLYEYNLNGILYYNGTLSQRVLELSNKKIQFINLHFNNNTIDIIPVEIPICARDYQLEAVEKLKDKKNAILSLPCGMGKTYTAALLAKNYDNIIILSPLRYLAFQTLEHFKTYMGKEYSPILISTDGKRNIDDINNYIKDKNIISSTYDSIDIVIKLLEQLENVFIIIDEFHNINDTNNDMNKILLSEHNKLFLSATPLLNFKCDTTYSYSWNDAIKNKYICDFNIFIPDKNENYNNFVKLIDNINNESNIKLIKKAYFILKSMLYNGDKKCICYMTTINKAIEMTVIFEWMGKLLNIELEYMQIDCNTKKTIRENYIDQFKKTHKLAIMINVHILDEGINIPECDSVFITQPSNNMINIVQRMCRANRILDNKLNCNIYLWCSEKKTDKVLEYIYTNTSGYIKDKVYIYNTHNKTIINYKINNNIEENDIKINNKLKETFIKYIKHNNIVIDDNLINILLTEDNKQCNIKDSDVAKYLGISLITIRKRLANVYSKGKYFIENIDFIKIKSGITSSVDYMLNYKCFEKIVMKSDSAQSENIKMCFSKLSEFLINYNSKHN